METQTKIIKLLFYRRAVQLLVLSIIVLAALDLLGSASSVLPWLSRFSPLMTMATRVAARQWTPYFCGGVVMAFISLFFPRLFCGWLCPLGTCIDIIDGVSLAAKRRMIIRSRWWLAFSICIASLAAAVAGFDAAGFVDPLTITGHTAAVLISSDSSVFAEGLFGSKAFFIDIVTLTIFFIIMAMTAFGRRTWCRTLCPLGGLLGVLALVSLNQRNVSDQCVSCGKCERTCKMGAIDRAFKQTTHQSCVYCSKCERVCPKSAISFKQTKNL